MILRVKAYQEFACYRKPMSYNFWESYPLPSPSNVRGWFHRVIEAKEYVPMSAGITGSYKAVVHDLQTLIKFDRVRNGKEDPKSPLYLEGFNSMLSKSPTYVTNLYGVELVIYIKADRQYLEKFAQNVMLNEYPSLGRREDLLRVDSVEFVEPQPVDFYDEPHKIEYGIYLNRQTAYSLNLQGINYRLNFKYDAELLKKTGIRYFEKRDVVYVDGGLINSGGMLFDREENRIVDLIGDL